MPPIVRLQNLACMAYQTCVMSAEQTIDSANDIDTLTIVWDLDITVDSNGDGIKDNDADLVGTTVQHIFRTSGMVRVKAMAWDENPERPGQATMVIDVAPPERNSIEQISAGLIGEEANSVAQFGLLIGILLLLALLTRRRKAPSESPWAGSEEGMLDDAFDTPTMIEQAQARRPSTPPPMSHFIQESVVPPTQQIDPLSRHLQHPCLKWEAKKQAHRFQRKDSLTDGRWNNGATTAISILPLKGLKT